MSPLGRPALRLLMGLKLRGILRKQWRRLRTPSGLILSLVGMLLFAVWFGSLLLHWFLSSGPPVDPEGLRPACRLGALVLTLLALSSSLTHRGLFVPSEEIERLFSAPLSRADLIRYRLMVSLGRGAFGGLILGLVLLRHMPSPLFAFLGVLVAVQTLPVLGQMSAILAGALEMGFYRRLKILWSLALPLGILVVLGVLALVLGADTPFGEVLVGLMPEQGFRELASHPVLATVTLPFEPWARMVTAQGWGQFLPWFGVSLGLWWLLFELTARLPVDFRELSLQTSASVAARLRRLRRGGGGASAGQVTRHTLGLRIPWLFGRGPAGAVAWRKTGAIIRKARGTLLISIVVLAFVTFLSLSIFGHHHDDAERAGGTLLVAVLGMFYLAGGLRFDFRDELDRMETIKAWPLASWRLFLAMLAPEVVLISGLVAVAVLVRSVLSGGLEPFAFAAISAVPLLVFAWVALDNAVFLLIPVRMVPGQEGALQNAGRGMLLLFLRFTLLGAVGAVAALAAVGAFFALTSLDLGQRTAAAGAFSAAWLVLLALDAGLVALGSWTLRRFDVARDRG